jgi:hypothetical protein
MLYRPAVLNLLTSVDLTESLLEAADPLSHFYDFRLLPSAYKHYHKPGKENACGSD